jgi:ATP-dependent Clp protease ATP-binding subunit ClpC
VLFDDLWLTLRTVWANLLGDPPPERDSEPPVPPEPVRRPPPPAPRQPPERLADVVTADQLKAVAETYSATQSFPEFSTSPPVAALVARLVQMAPPAILAPALAQDEWGLRIAAAMALAQRGSPEDRDLLAEHFTGTATWVDMLALRSLSGAGGRHLGALLARVTQSGDPARIELMLGELETGARAYLESAPESEIRALVSEIPLARARGLEQVLTLDEHGPGLTRLRGVLSRHVAETPLPEAITAFGRVLGPDDLTPAHGVDEVVRQVVAAISREGRRSVLVIGPHGVGKTAVLLEAARRLAGEPRAALVVEASTGDLLRETRAIGEWQTRLLGFVDEIRQPKPVLWLLPDANNLLDAGRPWDQPNEHFGTLLAPRIARGEIAILAESTAEELERGLRRDPRILDLFTPVRMDPPGDAAERAIVESVLLDLALGLERATGRTVAIDPEFVPSLLGACRMFAPGMVAPGRSLALLREVAARAREECARAPAGAGIQLDRNAILAAVTRRTGIPAALADDREPLDRAAFRRALRRRVLGQDEALEALVDRIALIKAGLTDPGRPLGVFLFAGPTGVGKTELARALAEALFGSEERLVRLDMSEFQTAESLERLVGSPGVAREHGLMSLAARVRAEPFAVVLLDEFEKAHPAVFDLFLQVFDAGRLTDARGQTAHFHGAILIMTSNLGYGGAPRAGFSPPPAGAGVHREIERFFRPEFLNRIDRVLTFSPLDLGVMRRIAEKELAAHLERHGILRRGLVVEYDPAVLSFLIEAGFTPEHGARGLKRVIEQRVLTPLARAIVDRGESAAGALALLRLERGEVAIDLITEDDLAEIEAPGEECEVELSDRLLGARERVPAEDLRARAAELEAGLATAGEVFARELAPEKEALAAQARAREFWDDPGTARRVMAALGHLDRIEERLERSRKRAGDLVTYLAARRLDGERAREAGARYTEIRLDADLVGLALALRRPHDASDAFLLVQALGEPALDADAALRLARMYLGWAERWGFATQVLAEELDGDRVRQATVLIEGTCVYGLLRGESGLHAFVERRVAGERPQRTALARVTVLPTPETIDFEVAPGDLTSRRRPPDERRGPLVPIAAARVEVAHGPSLTVVDGTSALPPDRLERHLVELVTVRAALAAGRAGEATPPPEHQVRRYILSPSPEVRDLDSGLRSGRLERVLAGALDPFLRHRVFGAGA